MHGRIRSFAARAALISLPVGGLVMAAGIGSASAAHTPAAHTATSKAAVQQALQRLLHGSHGTNHAVRGEIAVKGTPVKVKSNNWSGYANTGATFTKVSSTWTEPSVKCPSAQSLAAFWVGIDGYSSDSVEQDGTLAYCAGSGAAPVYYSWWEMYPSNDIQTVGSSVKPGDKITASVVRSGTKYTLKVTDATHTGNSFTKTESCGNCKNSSAEWIAEAPTSNGSIVPLPNFGTWTNNNSSVSTASKTGSINAFPAKEITMVDSSGKVKAQPSALSNGGKTFKSVWKSAT